MENPPTFTFPPHRRRPLRSQINLVLEQFFTLLNDDSYRSLPHQPLPEFPKLEKVNGGGKLDNYERVDKENFLSIGENLGNENGVCDSRKEEFQLEVMEIEEVFNLDLTRGNVVNAHDNCIAEVDSFGIKSQMGNADDSTKNPQQDHPFRLGSDNHMEDVGTTLRFENEKDDCIHEICDTIGSSLCVDESSKENSLSANERFSGDFEQELQIKEIALQKLLSDSCENNSSALPNADDEIEEGEFHGDPAVYSQIAALLFEDSTSSKNDIADKMQISEGITDEKTDPEAEQARLLHNNTESNEKSRNQKSSLLDVGCSEKGRNEMQADIYGDGEVRKSGMISCGNATEAAEKAADSEGGMYVRRGRETNYSNISSTYDYDENISHHDQIASESLSKNQGSIKKDTVQATAEKKRGRKDKKPGGNKENKKRRERIERAEERRKLGVKRLKLKPVSNPKTVVYCRHYIKGRCKEGEKCKYSHDIVPETKSQPCRHFARQSCMKGDNCPFDHELSKYSCDNMSSKGFCIRGANCLFSHKVPIIKCTSSQPEIKSPSLLGNSNSMTNLNLRADHSVKTKPPSVGIPACKKLELNVEGRVPKATSILPKGIKILSQGGSSSVESKSKHKQVEISKMVDNGVEVDNQIGKRIPKGINFLSFGKVSPDTIFSKRQTGIQSNQITPVLLSEERQRSSDKLKSAAPSRLSSAFLADTSLAQWTGTHVQSTPTPFFHESLLSNASSSAQKALLSTLACAAKFESGLKIAKPVGLLSP